MNNEKQLFLVCANRNYVQTRYFKHRCSTPRENTLPRLSLVIDTLYKTQNVYFSPESRGLTMTPSHSRILHSGDHAACRRKGSMRARELPILQQFLSSRQRHGVWSLECQHDFPDLVFQLAVEKMATGTLQRRCHIILNRGQRLSNETRCTGDAGKNMPLQRSDLPQTTEQRVTQ